MTKNLADPAYVVHIAYVVTKHGRETTCERFVNDGFAFWHSSQLAFTDAMVTCVMCIGART